MKRPKFTPPDANQNQIADELRACGLDVDDVHNLPGLYDLVVSGERVLRHGQIEISISCSVRVEIKTEIGKPEQSQVEYLEKQRHPESYIIARSAEDVLQWFGII